MAFDPPNDLFNCTQNELMARVAHAKRVTDFDRKLAERIFKSLKLHWNPKSHFAQRVITELADIVSATVNPLFKKDVVNPKVDATVREERERRRKIDHLISNDPAEELYSTVAQIVRMTFPAASGANDNGFIRRRVANCLIGLRNNQQTLVREYKAKRASR